ncbi:DUF1610 domain-containing protein [archaeon]|nr:MAG: DUF1610 domain-containing protein [archaeon]
MMKCTTCNTDVLAKKNFVRFNCPDCGQVEIVRCLECKQRNAKYSCSGCAFQGP